MLHTNIKEVIKQTHITSKYIKIPNSYLKIPKSDRFTAEIYQTFKELTITKPDKDTMRKIILSYSSMVQIYNNNIRYMLYIYESITNIMLNR